MKINGIDPNKIKNLGRDIYEWGEARVCESCVYLVVPLTSKDENPYHPVGKYYCPNCGNYVGNVVPFFEFIKNKANRTFAEENTRIISRAVRAHYSWFENLLLFFGLMKPKPSMWEIKDTDYYRLHGIAVDN